MRIKRMVKQTIERHRTNEPLRIASQMGILIFYEDLKNIWGYYNTSKRIMMIHVNRNLCDKLQRFVVAHELGHRVLHPEVNVPFLRFHTLQSIDKLEREANQFAVELLMPDELMYECIDSNMTVRDAAAEYGVPEELIVLKKLPSKRLYY